MARVAVVDGYTLSRPGFEDVVIDELEITSPTTMLIDPGIADVLGGFRRTARLAPPPANRGNRHTRRAALALLRKRIKPC